MVARAEKRYQETGSEMAKKRKTTSRKLGLGKQ
jgi:hypothetical protein